MRCCLNKTLITFSQSVPRVGGNAKPLAGKAKVFFRGSFHAHIVQSKAQSIGNVLPHGRDMRCQLGCLTQNSGINVANSITGFIQQTANLPQQHQGICSLVPRVGIRKMLADIPQRRRAKQCIRNCVQQHICIGMAQQPFSYGIVTPPIISLRPSTKR